MIPAHDFEMTFLSHAARLVLHLLLMTAVVGSTGCGQRRVTTAATSLAEWSAVEALRRGQAIELRTRQGEMIAGQLEDADASGVRIRDSGGRLRTIVRHDTLRVTVVEAGPDSVRNGTLIGMAIGIAYVAAVFTYLARGEDEQSHGSTVRALAIGAGLGAGAGALVDQMRRRPHRRVVYDGSGTVLPLPHRMHEELIRSAP
jgi:hypothetical protein